MSRLLWLTFYVVFAGFNFGYVLRDRDFPSGFNLAAGLLCVLWAYDLRRKK